MKDVYSIQNNTLYRKTNNRAELDAPLDIFNNHLLLIATTIFVKSL